MHRFYVETVPGNEVALTDAAQLHHLRDVLRLKAGDGVIVFDSHGKEYSGLITGLDKRQVLIQVTPLKLRLERRTKITLACAVPKGKVMDDIISYLTQLGVDAVVPLLTERVVVRLDDAGKKARRERWEKIAISAARQSQRSNVPRVGPVTGVAEVVSNSGDYDLKLIPTLAGERKQLKDVLPGARPKNILVLVGPEGDFTPGEVRLALDNGFIPVSLGEAVLRVATAAIAVTGFIKLALGE
jgi:16S rRNA (uracil1498-N3)-methyltransferase